MVKATLRSAVLLGLLAWSGPSFAEVQNIKVGGDVTIRAFHRENLDLHDEKNSNTPGLDKQDFFMGTTGINIGADLTENVSATIRAVNERDWDSTGTAEAGGDFDLGLAYITLKELFYSPLTLQLGTQPIVWGRGFVLGSGLLPRINTIGDDPNASITANEYTGLATAFDAARVTLDLSNLGGLNLPLTADYVYIKLDENNPGNADDVNLQGVNFSSQLDAANAELEAYFLNKRDQTSGTPADDDFGTIYTIGVRGSAKPVDGAYLYGELAYQWGKRGVDAAGVLKPGSDHQALAVNLGLEYAMANVATQPMLGAEWRFYSGKDQDGAVSGWAAIAPGYFRTALREFQTQSTVAGFYANDQAGVTSAGTNQHELALYGSFSPIEDLTVSPRLAFFMADVGIKPTASAPRERHLGTEWDTNVVYDYTDDVQLGLLYALFAPGSAFRTPNDATAQELVSTVSVKF